MARRPVAEDGLSRQILEKLLRASDVLAELGSTLMLNSNMRVSVACDFVPFVCDSADDARESLGNPTQNEEGALDSVAFHQGEHPLRVLFHPRRKAFPVPTRQVPFERRYLKVVLDIDTHRIDDSAIPAVHFPGHLSLLLTANIRMHLDFYAESCSSGEGFSPHGVYHHSRLFKV